MWSLFPIFYGRGTVVLSPPQAVQSSKIVTDVMTAIPFTSIVLPPSLLEDTVKEYNEDFTKNSSKLRLIGFGGGKAHFLPRKSLLLSKTTPSLD